MFRRTALWMLLLVGCPFSVWAQLGTVDRNVILRRDPATTSRALEHLPQGTRVMLVDSAPDSGFCHFRTEDEEVGWVWSKYISVSNLPTLPGAARYGTAQPTSAPQP